MRLKNKVSLITGSGKGIGKSIALLFAQEGSNVIVCSRTKRDLEKVEEEIARNGGSCSSVVADVSNKVSVDKLIQKVIDEYGKIDILVNNAGIYPSTELLEMSEKEWDAVININLKSLFYCCKAVLPIMMKQKRGKIINMSSVTGPNVSSPGQTHYSAAKAGVLGFTISLALEVAKYGINVNAISPGSIKTPGIDVLLNGTVDPIADSIPLGIGEPIEIARTALFLASDDSQYITGQTIIVDGGNIIQEHKKS